MPRILLAKLSWLKSGGRMSVVASPKANVVFYVYCIAYDLWC